MIRPIGFAENVWPVSVGLARSERRKALAEAGGRLVLRSGEHQHPWIAQESADPFPHLRQAINKANKILLSSEDWRIAEVAIEELPANTSVVWNKGGDELEVHCALVTNPQAVLLCGQSAPQIPCVHVPVGSIVACDPHTWRSAINGGETTRIHLILTLVKALQRRDQEKTMPVA